MQGRLVHCDCGTAASQNFQTFFLLCVIMHTLLAKTKRKLLSPSRRPSNTLKNGPWKGASQLTLQNMNVAFSVRIPIKLHINPSSFWLAPLLHSNPSPSFSVWPMTNLSTLVLMSIWSAQSSSIASKHSDPYPLHRGSLQRVPFPTVQSFHPTRPFICIPGVVSLPLWYTEKDL